MTNELKRASFGRRYFARGLDFIFVGLPTIIITMIIFNEPNYFWVFIVFLYYFLSLLLFNQTIGNKLLKTKIISLHGEITWKQILVRLILSPLSFFEYSFYSFIYSFKFWIKPNETKNKVEELHLIHDRIAKTEIIISDNEVADGMDYVKAIGKVILFIIGIKILDIFI